MFTPPACCLARPEVDVNTLPFIAENGQMLGVIRQNHALMNMYAVCSAHQSCIKSRTYSDRRSAVGGGHPIGYLAAWLAGQAAFASKAEHMLFKPTFPQRRAGRDRVKTHPAYLTFKALEVAAAEGESEPERVPAT